MLDFDVIVVGGGASGCILAARLSEDSRRRVALLEAGPDTPPDAVPADIADTYPVSYSNPAYFWEGLTAATKLGGPRVPYPQARVMGGGSSVMGMWALRGQPSDYDAWVEAGATGWGWNDVLPAFNRLESDLDYKGPLHGDTGPVPIRRHAPSVWPRFVGSIAEAAAKRGLPVHEDINADFRDGVFPVPVTNTEGGRVSSAAGYLTPEVRRRQNLTIMAGTTVERLTLNDRAMQAVEARRGNEGMTIACREVVIAAGAIGTPSLLLRSGIGPAEELRGLGIRPRLDLSGVGRNLQNHCIVNLATWIAPPARQSRSLRTYGLACARISSGHALGRAGDLHLQFIARTSPNAHGDRLGIVGAALYAPLSQGRVTLASPDSRKPPVVDFQILSHPADKERLAIAVTRALALLDDPPVRTTRGSVFSITPSSLARRLNRPGLGTRLAALGLSAVLDTPAPVRTRILGAVGRVLPDQAQLVRNDVADLVERATPIFHPTGTCPIGRGDDPNAVLDPHCAVRGAEGLFVADASIMPSIPTGNTCLPAMMIAEHFAELHVVSARNGPSH